MWGKQYVAIFLSVIFLPKLLTVEANLFSYLADTEVVLLNPFCKKKNAEIKEDNENFKILAPVKILKMARVCSNNYQISAENEISENLETDYKIILYKRPLVNSVHPRKLFPPPKYLLAT